MGRPSEEEEQSSGSPRCGAQVQPPEGSSTLGKIPSGYVKIANMALGEILKYMVCGFSQLENGGSFHSLLYPLVNVYITMENHNF